MDSIEKRAFEKTENRIKTCPENSNLQCFITNEKSCSEKKYFTVAQRRRYQRKRALAKKHADSGKVNKSNLDLELNCTSINQDFTIEALNNQSVVLKPAGTSDPHFQINFAITSNSKKPLIISEKMETKAGEKSREQVLAEREAKRLAKQITKGKQFSTPEKTVIIENQQKQIQQKSASPVLSSISKDAKSLQSKNDEKSRENILAEVEGKRLSKQVVKDKQNLLSGEAAKNKDSHKVPMEQGSAPLVMQDTGKAVESKNEKSREEVMAEREAKKLAKQLAKQKVKVNSDVTTIESKISACIISETTQQVGNTTPESLGKFTPKDKLNNEDEKSEKTKSELKAERRAKQEAQRAAKELLQSSKSAPSSGKKVEEVKNTGKIKLPVPSSVDIKKSQSPEKPKLKLIQTQHKVKLFNHLYGERETAYLVPSIPLNSKEIHPAIVRLGVQYASHIIMGSNARCIALLNALKQVIEDYTLPPNVEFSRGFEAHLTPCINFLKSCRPPAVSMNNALKHIKWQLTQLPHAILEYEAKSKLKEAIDTYVKEQIEVAGQAISIAVCNKISDGDIILTYGCSSLVEHIITEAAASKCFRVVVVAAHPWNEGREMLRRLTVKGVKCSLVMISALSFVMREINKVILGAGALLANGYVMARAGTAQVAMVANAHNVPVLVCCETHKFSERVQTDSFVYNEIGNPDDLVKCNPSYQDSPLCNWRTYNSLTLLNLTYDVTPPDLVTAVVTELAILPCTSVPVILRIKPSEFNV